MNSRDMILKLRLGSVFDELDCRQIFLVHVMDDNKIEYEINKRYITVNKEPIFWVKVLSKWYVKNKFYTTDELVCEIQKKK